jgi:Fe-S-cluster containining protein
LPRSFLLNSIREETALEILSRVMDLYAQIDKSVAEFQLKCGLRCPTGCGACCPTAYVETTILEMMPIANEILCRDEADVWLQRLTPQMDAGKCRLYISAPEQADSGHCSFYRWRPSLCRLFGFSAVRTRSGAKALSVCKHISENDPLGAAAAAVLADQAPAFIYYSAQVYRIHPVLGNALMPINTALRHAIERIGLQHSFAYGETLRDNSAA